MNLDEKLRMAEMLDSMGVDIIEAGFPSASKGDFESVFKVSQQSKNAIVAGLCRTIKKDIDAVGTWARNHAGWEEVAAWESVNLAAKAVAVHTARFFVR